MLTSTWKRVLNLTTPLAVSLRRSAPTRPPSLEACCSSLNLFSHSIRPSHPRPFHTTSILSNAPNPHLTNLLRTSNPSLTFKKRTYIPAPYKLSLYATPNHTMLTLSTQASTISRSVDPSHSPTQAELNQSLTVLTLTTRMHASSRLPKGSRKSDLGKKFGESGVQAQAEEITELMLLKVRQLLEKEVQPVVTLTTKANKAIDKERISSTIEEQATPPPSSSSDLSSLDPRLIGSTRYPWPRPTSIKMEYRGKGPGRKAFHKVFKGPHGEGLEELVEGVDEGVDPAKLPPKKRIHILQEKEVKRLKEKKKAEEFAALKATKAGFGREGGQTRSMNEEPRSR
ncbi:BQ2448_7549 [Microbotryum intermedium]|uniref:BQ2448_7549 protein n=1 Tax=Microbotryum intermedium TaxID=269621 RepID=A0A238FL68_9BASI|nr:BQ2448_7549 [Microbotryum intermedium]